MLLNAKSNLLDGQEWYNLTHSWGDNVGHIFSRGICPKVNAMAQLEFELAAYASAVQYFNPYTTATGMLLGV